MKLSMLLALMGSVVATNELVDRAPIPGVISMPFSRTPKPLQRRGSFVDIQTGASYLNYIVNITVGTPAQPITLSLDTGSSDTILISKESPFCVTNSGYCPSVGYYNANKSSTYKFLASNFSSQFGFASQGQGSGASGDVAQDTFAFGGATLKNQQFDIAYGNFSIALSILGLSYAAGENQGNTNPYPNFPLALANSGATNLAAFSLWKNAAVNGHDGQVLFGGVDTTKYNGSLITLNTQTRSGFPAPVAFDVLLNGVALSGNSSFPAGQTGSVLHVLDCGTSYSIIPDDWIQPIYDQFNVTYFTANDTAYVDCGLYNKAYTVDFTFDTLTIQVPIAAFVSLRSQHPDVCSFGLVPAGQRIALLGDNFLSSAYTVFDLSNNQISLANRDFGSTTDNVVVVPSGGVKSISSSATGVTSLTPSQTATPTGSAPATTATKKSSASAVSFSALVVGISFGLVFFGPFW